MARVITQQSTENMEYVRKLLRQKLPAFSATLELAADLVAQELSSPPDGRRHQRFPGLTTSNLAPPPSAENVARAIASAMSGGFARDFATADGERVVIAALNQRQFADLAKATRLAGTFAFAERLLHADFSDRGDLYTHRDTIAALLAAWFARRTVADLAAVFGGTSVPWARLQNLTGRPGARHLSQEKRDGSSSRPLPCRGGAITPNRKTLYVGCYDHTVTPISTATNRARKPIFTSRGHFVFGEHIAITP